MCFPASVYSIRGDRSHLSSIIHKPKRNTGTSFIIEVHVALFSLSLFFNKHLTYLILWFSI